MPPSIWLNRLPKLGMGKEALHFALIPWTVGNTP